MTKAKTTTEDDVGPQADPVIDWSQQVTAAMHDTMAEQAARDIEKRERQEATNAILVTTSQGNVFQGNEVSQSRMSHVLAAYAEELPDSTVDWILADNSVATVTLAELDEALRLSVDSQNAIWMDFVGKTTARAGGKK
jgi:hypothetical protein